MDDGEGRPTVSFKRKRLAMSHENAMIPSKEANGANVAGGYNNIINQRSSKRPHFFVEDRTGHEVWEYEEKESAMERRMNGRIGVWNSDSHLAIFSNVWRALVICRDYLCPFVTVTPAAWVEENVQHVMAMTDSEADHSLTLQIYVALSVGALQFNPAQAEEFWCRARRELGFVFDQTNREVAMALKTMALHVLFWKEDFELATYYQTLSLAICRQLKLENTDTYLHCLYAIMNKPNSTRAELQSTWMELERVERHAWRNNIDDTIDPASYYEATIINKFLSIIIKACSARQVLELEGCLFTDQGQRKLNELVSLLVKIEGELSASSMGRHNARLFLMQMLHSAIIVCCRCLGRRREALEYAIRFLEDLKEIKYCLGAVWNRCDVVLQTLLEADRKDLFVELLDLIETKGFRWKVARRIAQSYGPLLAETRRNLASAAVNEGVLHYSQQTTVSRPLHYPVVAIPQFNVASTPTPATSTPTPTVSPTLSEALKEQKRRAKLQRLREENQGLEQQATRMEKEIIGLIDQGILPQDVHKLLYY